MENKFIRLTEDQKKYFDSCLAKLTSRKTYMNKTCPLANRLDELITLRIELKKQALDALCVDDILIECSIKTRKLNAQKSRVIIKDYCDNYEEYIHKSIGVIIDENDYQQLTDVILDVGYLEYQEGFYKYLIGLWNSGRSVKISMRKSNKARHIREQNKKKKADPHYIPVEFHSDSDSDGIF